jgi:hypothetical protein
VHKESDATVRVLVGEGSPVRLGTPALVLDIELSAGGEVTTPVPPEFQGFAYVLEGEAAFGANRRRAKPPQLVLLGRGDEFRVTDASPGTRFLLMAGQPYGEAPRVQRAVRGLDPSSLTDGTQARPEGFIGRGGRTLVRSAGREARAMEDGRVIGRINDLADEEHGLWLREARGEASVGDRERLKQISVMLDQCWDLLHQRRALRSAGEDPNQARVRDEGTVEGYLA